MKNNGIKRTVRLSVVASLYVVLTLVFSFLSYGDIQFRIAEMLILLCFFRKDYGISIIIGCLISNLFSPMGIADVVFGTFATILSVVCVMNSKRIYLTPIYPTLFNGVIVGAELYLLLDFPLILSIVSVAIGEAVVLIIGCIIFKRLQKNEKFLELIEANQNI